MYEGAAVAGTVRQVNRPGRKSCLSFQAKVRASRLPPRDYVEASRGSNSFEYLWPQDRQKDSFRALGARIDQVKTLVEQVQDDGLPHAMGCSYFSGG
jgi:hypothetical protein